MTQDFITEMFHMIDTRDWDGLRGFFCEDVTYERPGYDPIVGLDDLMRFYRDVRVIASGRHLLSKVVIDDGGGASWGRFVGRHRNGEALDERFADVYTFEGGRVKARASYFFRPAV